MRTIVINNLTLPEKIIHRRLVNFSSKTPKRHGRKGNESPTKKICGKSGHTEKYCRLKRLINKLDLVNELVVRVKTYITIPQQYKKLLHRKISIFLKQASQRC